MPTAIVWGTLGIATTVLLEATLSFLGIGVQPPKPSWGNIIYESQSYFPAAPWLVFFPGAIILLTALSFNLVGDALRDILDPTQRGSRLMAAIWPGASFRPSPLSWASRSSRSCFCTSARRSGGARRRRSATAQMVANVRHRAGARPAAALAVLALSAGLVQGDLGRSYIREAKS